MPTDTSWLTRAFQPDENYGTIPSITANPDLASAMQEGEDFVTRWKDGRIDRVKNDQSKGFIGTWFPRLVQAGLLAAGGYVAGGLGGLYGAAEGAGAVGAEPLAATVGAAEAPAVSEAVALPSLSGGGSGTAPGITGATSLFPEAAPMTASQAALQTTNPDVSFILNDMAANAASNDAAIAAAGGVGAGSGAMVASPASEGSSAFGPVQQAELNTAINSGEIPAGKGASPWDFITNSADSVGGYVKNNPIKTMLGATALNSVLQSGMMKGVNEAQNKSYQDYINAINPPESVKSVRFNTLAENARTQGALAQKKIDESLAVRGVRGKGKVAPTGDVALSTKDAINAAFNQIYGTYNVPSTPGPVNYAPSAGQLAGTNVAQMTAQSIPLMMLMQKYGVTQ